MFERTLEEIKAGSVTENLRKAPSVHGGEDVNGINTNYISKHDGYIFTESDGGTND